MIYSTSIDKVGLVATSLQEQPHVPQRGLSDKDHLHCDYCGKSQHTKEYCWKLHGRPTKGVEVNGWAHLDHKQMCLRL